MRYAAGCIAATAALFLLASVAFAAPSDKALPPLVSSAHKLQEAGDHKKALKKYTRAIERGIGNARQLYTWRGQCHDQLKEYEKALNDFEEALKLKEGPDSTGPAFRELLDARAQLGQHRKALKRYRKRARDNPEDPAALQDHAAALIHYALESSVGHRKRNGVLLSWTYAQRAVETLTQLIELAPQRALAYRWRARIRLHYNRHEEALKDLNEAIFLDPGDAGDHVARGTAYWGTDQHKESIEEFNRALKLEPENARALLGRGRTQMARNKYEPAIKDLTRALELEPDNKRARYLRAAGYFYQKEWAGAIRDYNWVIENNPSARAYRQRGKAYQAMHRLDKALADYTHLLESELDDRFVREDRARIYRRMGQPAKALKDLNQAVRVFRDKEFPDGRQRRDASTELGRMLRLDMAELRVRRAVLCLQVGQFKKATKDLARAIELGTDEPDRVHALSAYAHFKLKQDPTAARHGRAFLRREQWHDRWSLEAATVGTLALRRNGQQLQARRLLEAARKRTESGSQRLALLRYQLGELDARELMQRVRASQTLLLARFVLAWQHRLNGENDAAIPHLYWLRDRAPAHHPARIMAEQALEQLGASPPELDEINIAAPGELRAEADWLAQALRRDAPWLLIEAGAIKLKEALGPEELSYHDSVAELRAIEGAFSDKAIVGDSRTQKYLIFGPYMTLSPGRYAIVFRARSPIEPRGGWVEFDLADAGKTLMKRNVPSHALPTDRWRAFALAPRLNQAVEKAEYRANATDLPMVIDRVYVLEFGG